MSEPTHPEVAILNTVLALSEPERSAYLDKACAGNPALRKRVEELLQANEQAENFLESPPAGLDFTRSKAESVPLTEKPGDRIGRYKLLQQIGEGGCGLVYMAEQEEPVRRRVALKVIKLGMDTRQVIARFEAERQALALMDHPNIAKVLDAGATETGRPYFVMELVRGIKITEFCDENKLSTDERLKLFIQVCQAVQHAHQKGVIHRDIKPSNILVTVNDPGSPGAPKVIDFGIAKATQGRLTDHTLFTAFEQFIGTPAYMSPEQAEMTSLDIDTRSDIYSLGVLLYELLTGKTPFDANELLQSGLDAMRRTIRETEPPKPSTRLTQELVSKSGIGNRKSEIKETIHLVRGDLDWIVMKSLEKNRAHRYETVNGLAADIQRHLENEPIVARPPSSLYRLQKIVLRNRLLCGAAGAVALVLFVGSGISTWMFFREREARIMQTHLRHEAEIAQANEADLRHRLELRVTVAQARTLLNDKKFDEAEKLLNTIDPDLIEPDTIHASLRRQLGWQRVLQNRWSDAAANYAAVMQVDGRAWDHDVALDYYNFAMAAVKAGDKPGYDRFRRSALQLHKNTVDPSGAEFWCGITLLTDADEKMMADFGGLYDAAGKRQDYTGDRKQEEISGNYLSRGLVDYRRGNYSAAEELIQHCAPPLKDPTIIPTALAVRAMIHHQTHHDEEARTELDSAGQAIDPVIQTGPSAFNARQSSQQGRYFEWVRAEIYLREARALIQGAPKAATEQKTAAY